jgi:hypothetical protein
MRDFQLFFKNHPEKAQAFHANGQAFNQKHAHREAHNLQRQQAGEAMDFTNHWSSALKDTFGSLKPDEAVYCRCAICEKELNDVHATDIEHYRPKGSELDPEAYGYWWLAYDYTNYYLACAECNRSYKHHDFPLDAGSPKAVYGNGAGLEEERPLLVNPMYECPKDFFRLLVIPDPQASTQKKAVILMPKEGLSGYALRKAEKTIDIFNLDLRYRAYLEDTSGKSHYEFLKTRTDQSRKSLCADFHRQLFALLALCRNQDFAGLRSYLQGEGQAQGIASLGLAHLVVAGQWSEVP